MSMLRKLLFDSVRCGIEWWIGVWISVLTGGISRVGFGDGGGVDSVRISFFSSCSSGFVSAFCKIEEKSLMMKKKHRI